VPVCTYCTRDRKSCGRLVAGALLIALVVSGSFELTARVLKIFCLALLAYVVVLFSISVPWGSVLIHTIVPHFVFSKGYLRSWWALLGTTIRRICSFGRACTASKTCEKRRLAGKSRWR